MKGVFDLRAWLNGRQPYAEGLALYLAHGGDAQLAPVLQQGETPFTKRKLRAGIEHLASLAQAQTAAPIRRAQVSNLAPAIKETFEVPAPRLVHPGETPAQHVALAEHRADRLAGFKRAAWLKARLELLATDEERHVAAKEIKALWRANQKSWDDEQYYLTFGYFPPEHAQGALDLSDRAAVTKRRNTLRTYLSSNRSPGAKQAAWTAELLELERSLAHE